MKYFSKEIEEEGYLYKTAGVKARDDVEDILRKKGFKEVYIPTVSGDREKASKVKKLTAHFKIRDIWKKKTAMIGEGDVLFVQYPTLEHSIFLSSVFRDLRKRGAKIIFLIHDLEYIRLAVPGNENMTGQKSKRLEIEQRALHFGNRIIVHNQAMIDRMVELGFNRKRLVSLDIFDYLIPEYSDEKMAGRKNEKDMPVIIAGNLRRGKAEYVYNLPETVEFNLYGVNFEDEGKSNIHYKGEFLPDELPYSLDGSFGLVWDGDTSETCSGVYGEYLKINNPHKTSLYLASGIPVLIWSKAALAGFVKENGAGIVVDSLYDIPDVIGKMSDEEYGKLKASAEILSEKLRAGYYTRNAISACKRHNG
ncbi:MAG TPA: galactofuranosyltransferase [Lachnospiraceae bacterium]|nr:galactofuranosyltransferase [Lachnospiraceae bacterium]